MSNKRIYRSINESLNEVYDHPLFGRGNEEPKITEILINALIEFADKIDDAHYGLREELLIIQDTQVKEDFESDLLSLVSPILRGNADLWQKIQSVSK